MNQHDQEFEQRVKSALDTSVTTLDIDTRTRLATGRAQALNSKSFFKGWFTEGNRVPTTALAAIAALAITLSVVYHHQDAPAPRIAQLDPDIALEILLGDGQQADSDPDFYIVMEAMLIEEEEKNAG